MELDPKQDFALLTMIQTLSFKEYDSQVKAFDDLDAKANWAIGYTSISAAAAGWLVTQYLDRTWPALFLGMALVCFIGAIASSFLAMLPRTFPGPPSSSGVLKMIGEVTAHDLAEEFISVTQGAVMALSRETTRKGNCVTVSYALIGTGYALLLVAILFVALRAPVPLCT